MEQTKKTFLELLETVLKIATPIGAVIAFVIGIYHYRDTQAEAFRQTYWEKRYSVYEEISLISSHLAHASSKTEMDSLKQLFWITFTGKSMLVEDLHVFNALRAFGTTLENVEYPDSLRALVPKAHAISMACRVSLKETWEPVPVSEIESMDD